MKSQFQHDVLSSFYLWLEYQLVSDDSQAYVTNRQNNFHYANFSDLPTGYVGYQGEYRQLVAEHSISNPNSGVFISGSFVSGSNILIDYSNGRVILPRSSGENLTITANSSVKEINTYLSENDEEQLILQNDFIDSSTDSPYLSSKEFKRDEKTFILPACFVRMQNIDNDLVALGGEVDTQSFIRVTVLSTDQYIFDGTLSFFSDKKHQCIKLIDVGNDPYGRSFTLKSFPYSYENLTGYSSLYVKDVRVSKVTKSIVLDNLQKNLNLGFIDFELSKFRYLNN